MLVFLISGKYFLIWTLDKYQHANPATYPKEYTFHTDQLSYSLRRYPRFSTRGTYGSGAISRSCLESTYMLKAMPIALRSSEGFHMLNQAPRPKKLPKYLGLAGGTPVSYTVSARPMMYGRGLYAMAKSTESGAISRQVNMDGMPMFRSA